MDINITVISVNDRPEITTSRIIDIGEGTKRVSSLQANDDSAGEMVWSLQDYGDTDANFTLTPEGLLQFRNHGESIMRNWLIRLKISYQLTQ